MMKFQFAIPLIAATAFAVPALSGTAASVAHADELTRAQVRAELAQLRATGYDQSVGEDAHYPDALQLAQARVNAPQPVAQAPSHEISGYGPEAAGISTSGGKRFAQPGNDGMKPIYFGQ
ncbi:DUF4148 domain-containing protein [Paraburkholderia sp. SOS3]|uniref:DUF4148 domain-containing protein n=1 Tax=Paraburkholderia sp. SOS3 TaxID=1926494 RepID=UPI001E3C37D1|nr:DUF4148 domain-containing protein [Paraburkholderia sp. SOS3]